MMCLGLVVLIYVALGICWALICSLTFLPSTSGTLNLHIGLLDFPAAYWYSFHLFWHAFWLWPSLCHPFLYPSLSSDVRFLELTTHLLNSDSAGFPLNSLFLNGSLESLHYAWAITGLILFVAPHGLSL